MSLNLIIMLIIGLVILGLVIGFVTSFLGDAQDRVTITEDDQRILDELKSRPGNFETYRPEVRIKQSGETGKIYLKIRNTDTSTPIISDGGDMAVGSGDLRVDVIEGMVDTPNTLDFGTNLRMNTQPINVDPGDTEAYIVSVRAERGLSIGSYYATFTLTMPDGTTEYTRVVTINVE